MSTSPPPPPEAQPPAADATSPTPDAPTGGGASPSPAPDGVAAHEGVAATGTPEGTPARGSDTEVEEAGEGPEEPAGDGEEAIHEGEPSPGADPARKRKRKRKRKKKPAEGGASAAPPAPAPPQKAKGPPRHRPATDRAPFHVGEEVFGKVTNVLDTAIMIDLAGKALAIFDRSEMEADDLVPEVGDRFVAHVHNDGIRGGFVVLTRKPLREEATKPLLEAAHASGELVKGLVTGVVTNGAGVEVDLGGVRAFAPASGMDLHPANANLAALVGQRLDFKVLEYKAQGRDVVVTRRPLLEAEARERRKHALGLLSEGQDVSVVARTLVDWGVFVVMPEAEGLEGAIHASELAHEPRVRVADVVKEGDAFQARIVKIDERGKVWLSRKALVPDPWAEARARFAPGTRHSGKVKQVERFGVFVELEGGLDGLVHVADLAFDRVEDPARLVQVGQPFDVVVHHFDEHDKKLALHPAPPPERAGEPAQRVQKHASVQAEVVKAEAAGLVVRILGVTGRQARGFVPAGQTGTARGTDLRKHFKPGTRLEVKVLEVDPRRGEAKLSIKGAKEDEERRAHKEYRQKLKAEGGFGTLGDLLGAKLRGG